MTGVQTCALPIYGATVNKENIWGETPLFAPCREGHENIVKYLIEHGTHINKVNVEGETSLFLVCKNGYETIVSI